MARVPFIGRLSLHQYLALLGSFILIGLESLITIITLALPQPVIRFCYNRSRNLFNTFSSPQGKRLRIKEKSEEVHSNHTKQSANSDLAIVSSIAQASDFTDLCALFGYYAEEHIVQTGDGFLLGLHRLGWRRGEEGTRVNGGDGTLKKKVVYMHHGLLMNSEVWVCMTEEERCLPFKLVERGFDVWLGNNRGNKYSKKSTRFSPNSIKFWDFSMDQFAFHDIPDSIDYILSTASQPSLSYIGFSQGTAQAFATLSIHPTLNDKVDVFIALAPAMSPAGLSNGIVDALIKASPEVIFLAFGRRSLLSSATMWQAILYPPIFVRIIDMSLLFLFNWTAKNISPLQKLAAYPHLYSYTSTKSLVHWFQIIRNRSFQMYDDDVQAPLSIGAGTKYYKVAKFPTRNIKTPIVLLYGGSDSLVDINVMLKELPKHAIAKEIPHFEHLDFLWGNNVDTLIFPHVFAALDIYSDINRRRSLLPFSTTNDSTSILQPPSYSEDERFAIDGLGSTSDTTAEADGENSPQVENYNGAGRRTSETRNPSTTSLSTLKSGRILSLSSPVSRKRARIEGSRSSSPVLPSDAGTNDSAPLAPEGCPASMTGYRQPDENSGSPVYDESSKLPTPQTAVALEKHERSDSLGSAKSLENLAGATKHLEKGGISLGVGKAAGGVISRGFEGLGDGGVTRDRGRKKVL
ncbi:MAG: cholesterol esterase [Pycnora praestabilis]|nr:MAG: cholesterol esterase [Pycnora praestabilis]